MGTLLQNIRFGLRMFAKNPSFTIVAVVTLALGIGANTSIFSLVNAILIRPLPYPDPEQLVGLGQWRNQPEQGYIQTGVSAPNIVDIRSQSKVFQQVCYYKWSAFNITVGSRPERVQGARISAELLPMFGVPPLIGRYFSTDEARPGRENVAILGEHLWQIRYGSDPAIVGKSIDLDQNRYVIVGVMPASYRFTWDQELDVMVPLALSAEELGDAGRHSRGLETLARLKPDVSSASAQAAMDSLAYSLAEAYPEANKGWGIKVEPLHAAYHRRMQTPLFIMTGAVACVLLIACANVANLLLARATVRRREIALRMAVGAGRSRLVWQLLTESLLLAGLGGAVGLLLALAGNRLLTLGLQTYIRIPNAKVVELDWRVAIFSIAITLATGVIFGLAPALTISKTSLTDALRDGGQGSTPEGGRRRLRNLLVLAEVSLALVLLAGAGLLMRTFTSLLRVDLGMDPHNLMTAGISLPAYKYSTADKQTRFYEALLDRLSSTPGIKSAGALTGGGSVFFRAEGQPVAAPGQESTANQFVVTPRFFDAEGTAILGGRVFTECDLETTAQVALVNETLARRHWPGASPIGRHLTILSNVYQSQTRPVPQTLEVVGIVKDIRTSSELWLPEAAIYVPFRQKPSSSVLLVVRTDGPPLGMTQAVRDSVMTIDAQQPVNNVQSMEQVVARQYGFIRFPMLLVWIFAGLAMLISAVGIFGVMSYTVSRRTREMAIRMALGAERHHVMRLVMREGFVLAAIGVGLGLVAALGLSRVMSSYLYGISATDPLTYLAAAVLLLLIALIASYFPARRAMRVDPMVALRYD